MSEPTPTPTTHRSVGSGLRWIADSIGVASMAAASAVILTSGTTDERILIAGAVFGVVAVLKGLAL